MFSNNSYNSTVQEYQAMRRLIPRIRGCDKEDTENYGGQHNYECSKAQPRHGLLSTYRIVLQSTFLFWPNSKCPHSFQKSVSDLGASYLELVSKINLDCYNCMLNHFSTYVIWTLVLMLYAGTCPSIGYV